MEHVTVMVPFLRGNSYSRENCYLDGIMGVPEQCKNHSYFSKLNLNVDDTCNAGYCDESEADTVMKPCLRFIVSPDYSNNSVTSSILKEQFRFNPEYMTSRDIPNQILTIQE